MSGYLFTRHASHLSYACMMHTFDAQGRGRPLFFCFCFPMLSVLAPHVHSHMSPSSLLSFSYGPVVVCFCISSCIHSACHVLYMYSVASYRVLAGRSWYYRKGLRGGVISGSGRVERPSNSGQ